MNDEVAARFSRLEIQVAHIERLAEQLNGVVIEQSRELDRVRKLLQRQGLTLETIEMDRIKSTNPKPPHYQ
jgi:SlyX protein